MLELIRERQIELTHDIRVQEVANWRYASELILEREMVWFTKSACVTYILHRAQLGKSVGISMQLQACRRGSMEPDDGENVGFGDEDAINARSGDKMR